MRRRFAFLLLLLFLTGCAAPTAGPPPTEAPRTTKPPPEPEPEVTIALVGDILLIDAVLGGRGADYPWARVKSILQKADLAIGNLETAVSTRGAPAADKQFTFRSHPRTLGGASRAGVDILSLANNHTLDYGRQALLDTLDHVRDAGMAPVGAGADAEAAAAPLYLDLKGMRIGVLAFTRVIPENGWVAGPSHPGLNPGWDPKPTLAAIRDARSKADAVIVLVHWGEEMKEAPRHVDAELAREMAAAGATLVAGHHPHVLQGFRWYDQSLVAFSLGNFIFTQSSSPAGRQSGILHVTLRKGAVARADFTPLIIEGGQPRPTKQPERKAIIDDRLRRLSRPWGTDVTSAGRINPPPGQPGRAFPCGRPDSPCVK